MSFVDKLMFWKKEPVDNFDSGLDLGPDPLAQPSQPSGYGYPQQPDTGMQDMGMQHNPNPMEQPRILHDPVQSAQQYGGNDKSLELISIKLDNIKQSIENINQRLINIERIAMDSQHQEKRRGQW